MDVVKLILAEVVGKVVNRSIVDILATLEAQKPGLANISYEILILLAMLSQIRN